MALALTPASPETPAQPGVREAEWRGLVPQGAILTDKPSAGNKVSATPNKEVAQEGGSIVLGF